MVGELELLSSTTQKKQNANYISKCKFSSSHIRASENKQVKLFNSVYPKYHFNKYLIINEIFYIFFQAVFKIQLCI